MIIFWSQETVFFCRLLNQHPRAFYSKTPRRELMTIAISGIKRPNILEMAISHCLYERGVPFFVLLYLVNSRGLFTNWEIPTLSQLAFQVSILLLFDHLCDKVFTRIFPLYIEDATTPSAKLSTDFVVTRTAVNLTIPAIHCFPTGAIPFRSVEFHFLAVVAMLLIQQRHFKVYREDYCAYAE